MEELQSLFKLQTNTKTSIEKFVRNYKKDGKDRKTKLYYETRIKLLEKYWEEFKNRHEQIILGDSDELHETHEYFIGDIYSNTENFYIESIALISSDLRRDFPPESNDLKEQSTKKGDDIKLIAIPPRQDDIKLPKISLPTFSGDYLTWSTFYDLFKSIVHDNDRLSPVQKLQYLKAHLAGEAKNLLSNINITSANYASAWKILIERYDNKRILIKVQLDVLFSQPSVNQESAKGVKSLLDKTGECLTALQNLGIDVENWDPILVHFVTQRLPYETLELWEQSLSTKVELPKWDELKQFLESRFRTLEAITSKRKTFSRETKSSTQGEKPWRKTQTFHVTASPCSLCRDTHAIRQCPKYLSLEHKERINVVKSKGLCMNCLGTGHLLVNCPSKLKCLKCKRSHHTTLHRDQIPSRDFRGERATQAETSNQISASSSHHEDVIEHKSFIVSQPSQPRQILLATALVKIVTPHGLEQMCRALIDPGSQASFVTEQVVQSLKLPKECVEVNVSGLGNGLSEKIKARVKLTAKPRDNAKDDQIQLQAFVLKRITSILPSHQIIAAEWKHLEGLQLADPNFMHPGRIDLLLGADVYPLLISEGVRKGTTGTPIGQRTIFGWVLLGEVLSQEGQRENLQNFHVNVNPNDDLRVFWELEELPVKHHLNSEEVQCEKHFSCQYSRCSDGRFQVRLPFAEDKVRLGASRNIAVARLLQMEKQFNQNSNLKEEYRKCIKEYLDLGHMTPTDTTDTDFLQNDEVGNMYYTCAYLPHHAVLKPSSTTTKVRIVFDASRRTSNGNSLNDVLLKGPTIQDTLFMILMRQRRYKIAFMADVQKMYRQVRMHPMDSNYQRIVWRDLPSEPIRDFKLTTVTFGVKSAPYLAIRTMQQLARDERHNYPIGAEAVLNEFYVDDLISGADSIEDALMKQFQIIHLLRSGGFELRKWASNTERIMLSVPEEERAVSLTLAVESENITALGMTWTPKTDTLSYKVPMERKKQTWTKRSILSEIAKLFDPIGWLAPVTVTAKILIQTLWIGGLHWDEGIPEDIEHQWNSLKNNLTSIQDIQIPRWIQTDETCTRIDLHGFCDASIKAYAAAVYVRVEKPDQLISVQLISAKTKVAPIKTVSLPKLELCGATLLAKLIVEIRNGLQLNISGIYTWTDSTIVLAWLRKHPSHWETFIANRVSQIHQLLGENRWAHVPTESNPADCASRGIHFTKLKDFTLWWNGPSWLKNSEEFWPKQKIHVETTVGSRKGTISLHTTASQEQWELLEKYSSLSKLIRVTAYVLRFVNNTRIPSEDRKQRYLCTEELEKGLNFWLRIIQRKHFSNELRALQDDKSIPKQSKLVKLHPFLDNDGFIRVGGRLKNATLPFSERHPIILPQRSHLTDLIIDSMHKTTMHGGSQLMLSLLRRKYWILNARNLIRSHTHRCISCFRQKAQTRTQLMADLPEFRIRKARPFAHVGIDYCGPFDLKSSKGRGIRSYKGYIAVFICMVTKAIHLEIVSDLSTLGFLAAFRRFVSRRGLCSDIYSDCGSNFIGANAILTRYKFEMVQQLEHEIARAIESQGIKWHFIPPSSPHFGGLWESGVKSVKTHLKRIIRNEILTYEEFNTLLTQIEASLNSRPLTEISDDPDDIAALTPGHFLIGGPLLSPPEPSFLDTNIHRLDRFCHIQKLHQTFWARWSSEYLHRLQQRPKWLHKQADLKENDLVLVKDERLPPSRWLMGRIIQTHPGRDNLTRVVTIKTQYNIMKRPITKICLLPIPT